MKHWRVLFLVIAGLLAQKGAATILGEPLERIPMQDSGRIKPFGTFANETLQLLYGKANYQGKNASEVVFTWLLIPDHWMNTPLIELRHTGLKEALKITSDERYFSPQALLTNERIPLVMQELNTVHARQEKLNGYYQAVQRLENQLGLFQAIRTGTVLRFVPDANTETWKAVSELDGDMREAFTQVTKGFVDSVARNENTDKPQASSEMVNAVDHFIELARQKAPDRYADMSKIEWELRLNRVQPFMWAWIFYLLGVLLMFAHFDLAKKGAWVFLLSGFFMHGLGMAMRVYVAGRPPVTNMYETVVWVPFGCVFFGLVLERFQGNKLLLQASSAVAIFCLILTNLAPTVLDQSIHPLEPVLRSNFWLSTHVLIINISYAAFFLAFAIGDAVLFMYLRDEGRFQKQILAGAQSIYRAMQIGVVLLAAGTILGGVWADYSWGRFWGWDPKETWALISLLGYVAVLHGRLVGWIRNFQMAVAAVVTFSLIIMAWYGVNFVLGAGLHSYGFGAGGVEYVMGFVVLHFLYVVYVSTVRYGRVKN